MRIIVSIALAVLFLFSAPAGAEDASAVAPAEQKAVQGFRSTDLPLPRFVSLKSDKIYVRAGPALRYPIRWIYTRDRLPVEIIQEFEAWRKIRDSQGDEGWVHQSLLSGARTAVIIVGDLAPLRERPSDTSRLVARLEPQVIAAIDKCDPVWCRAEAHGYKGWIERKFLWGIYEDEELN